MTESAKFLLEKITLACVKIQEQSALNKGMAQGIGILLDEEKENVGLSPVEALDLIVATRNLGKAEGADWALKEIQSAISQWQAGLDDQTKGNPN